MATTSAANALGLMIVYMIVFLLIFVVPWVLLFLALWRLTRTNKSIAESLSIIAAKLSKDK